MFKKFKNNPRRRLPIAILLVLIGLFFPICTPSFVRFPFVKPTVFVTGAVPSSLLDIIRFPKIKLPKIRGDRPDKLLLVDFLPPVGNQKTQNSCVGWSTAYYAQTYVVGKALGLDESQLEKLKWQFSYRYIWNQGNGGRNEGMSIVQAMFILKAQGCCTLNEMPINYSDVSQTPSPTAVSRARGYVASSIGPLTAGFISVNPETLKAYMVETGCPIVIGIPIYDDEFPRGSVSPEYVYRRGKQRLPNGFHAITLIGYDDSKKAFRMVNSWSPEWGDRGQLWIDETFVEEESHEAWGFSVNPARN